MPIFQTSSESPSWKSKRKLCIMGQKLSVGLVGHSCWSVRKPKCTTQQMWETQEFSSSIKREIQHNSLRTTNLTSLKKKKEFLSKEVKFTALPSLILKLNKELKDLGVLFLENYRFPEPLEIPWSKRPRKESLSQIQIFSLAKFPKTPPSSLCPMEATKKLKTFNSLTSSRTNVL